MRICQAWVVEDDAGNQTKERSTCLAQGSQSQRVQAEILQGALKKADMGFPGGPWIRLYVPNAGGMGLIPHQRTRSPLPQLKSLHDKTKTLGNQINKYKYFLKKKRPTWQKTCLKQPSIMGKTKPPQKRPTPFISSSLSHSSLWPDPWAIPVNRLEVCRWGKRNPMPPFSSGGFKPGEVMKCCLEIKFRGFTTILGWTLTCEIRLFATLFNRKSCVLPEEDEKFSFWNRGHSHPSKPSSIADMGDQ